MSNGDDMLTPTLLKRLMDEREKHRIELAAAADRFNDERDRRYAEVLAEKEKAVQIKEVADLAALQLAREIQTYKDEQANELREQINKERGSYVTQGDLKGAIDRLEAIIQPVAVANAELRSRIDVGPPALSALQAKASEGTGRRDGSLDMRSLVFAVIGAVGVFAGIAIALAR